jgi:hypothetical protein
MALLAEYEAWARRNPDTTRHTFPDMMKIARGHYGPWARRP